MPHERTHSLTRVLAYVAGVERGKVSAGNQRECRRQRVAPTYCCGRLKRRGGGSINVHCCRVFKIYRQLFREGLSEKVHPTIPKGIVGGFDLTVVQRNLKEWQERLWAYVCEC